MKKLSILFTMIIATASHSQDIIVFKTGDEAKVKILEILPDVVKYKKWDNQGGPSYSEYKANISIIRYKKGSKDVFDQSTPIKGQTRVVHGTEIVACTDCTPLAANGASADFNANGVPAGTWFFDKAHSNVMWETQYKKLGPLLTGRFNYFVLKNMNFDEGVPANISFEGYVRLNSVNTGEPGRDGSCLLTTFGTNSTNTSEPANIATLKSKPGTGRYSSTDASFLVDASFTLLNITKDVTVKMNYYAKSDIGNAYMAGIYSEFEINVLADFLPGNANIGDKVKIRIDNLMRNKK